MERAKERQTFVGCKWLQMAAFVVPKWTKQCRGQLFGHKQKKKKKKQQQQCPLL